ncbi:MAG: hypothetical protein H0X45_08610 [Planctomycetes bacterium]|nr:hypothetical protein [Planctomycetota bacterium]
MVVHCRRLLAAWLEPASIALALCVAVAGSQPSGCGERAIAAHATQREAVPVVEEAPALRIAVARRDRPAFAAAAAATGAFEVARYRMAGSALPSAADVDALRSHLVDWGIATGGTVRRLLAAGCRVIAAPG